MELQGIHIVVRGLRCFFRDTRLLLLQPLSLFPGNGSLLQRLLITFEYCKSRYGNAFKSSEERQRKIYQLIPVTVLNGSPR